MTLDGFLPVVLSLSCIALHRMLNIRLTSNPLAGQWNVVGYLVGTFFMFGSFLGLMLKFSGSQAVVMGIYLGYNISYIVWGMVKSR